MNVVERRCGTCRYAVMESIAGQIVRKLVCHEGPPNITMVPTPTPQGIQLAGMTMFPVVEPRMFCGRWAPLEQEPAALTVNES